MVDGLGERLGGNVVLNKLNPVYAEGTHSCIERKWRVPLHVVRKIFRFAISGHGGIGMNSVQRECL